MLKRPERPRPHALAAAPVGLAALAPVGLSRPLAAWAAAVLVAVLLFLLLLMRARRHSAWDDGVLGRRGADYRAGARLAEEEPLPEEDDWECPERDAGIIYMRRLPDQDE